MWKALCLVVFCSLLCASAPAQNFSGDDYLTGMTVIGKPGSDSSCPPIVWLVEPDTPAAKAGIQPGDSILGIDGHRGIDVVQARPLLRTKESTPITIELDGQCGPYRVTVGRIQASVLYDREGLKLDPDGGLYPKNATKAEMQRVSKISGEPPRDQKVFQVGHYPADLNLYYPGFEVFAWKEPQLPAVGGIEDGPSASRRSALWRFARFLERRRPTRQVGRRTGATLQQPEAR